MGQAVEYDRRQKVQLGLALLGEYFMPRLLTIWMQRDLAILLMGVDSKVETRDEARRVEFGRLQDTIVQLERCITNGDSA